MFTVNDISIGQHITFRLLVPHDNIVHQGIVSSLCDYESAKKYSDIDASYAKLAKSGKEVPDKVSDIYVVLTYRQGSVTQQTAFGRSWINQSTLELVDENTHHNIRVYNVDKQVAKEIVKSIRSSGYTADLID